MILDAKRFKQRGKGRIFVQCEEDIKKVKQTIHEIDQEEYYYMPEELVAVYVDTLENPLELIDLRKFELDINELTRTCIEKGIWIWCVGDTT
jgi:hypothetical protein